MTNEFAEFVSDLIRVKNVFMPFADKLCDHNNYPSTEKVIEVFQKFTATHNISNGQYVVWKGSLYKATANISSGSGLSGSNLSAVSNGGLNDLDSGLSTLNGTLTSEGVLQVQSLPVTKNVSLSTVAIYAYRSGQMVFIGGYFSNTSGIANGTTIATIDVGSSMASGNFACPAVQSDDNSIEYLSFVENPFGIINVQNHGNLGANKYCRFFMVLPYT